MDPVKIPFDVIWGTGPKPEVTGDAVQSEVLNLLNSAVTCIEREKYGDAHEKILKALSLDEAPPDKSRTIRYLANVRAKLDRWNEAIELYLGAIGWATGLERFHAMHTVGQMYEEKWAQNEEDTDSLERAHEMFSAALIGKDKELGPIHESTLDTMHRLGMVCLAMKDLSGAKKHLGELDKRERLIAETETQGGTMKKLILSKLELIDSLGSFYVMKEDVEAAEEMFKKALDGRMEQLGSRDPLTLDTIQNLANLYIQEGRLKDAEESLKTVLEATNHLKKEDGFRSHIEIQMDIVRTAIQQIGDN